MEDQPSVSFLGKYLLEKGLIALEDLQKAEAFQKRIGGRLGLILIRIGASAGDMRKRARMQNSRTLREDGLLKAWQGVTSVEEVLRVTGEQ